MARISKTDILQLVKGALYSLPLNVLMLIVFIGVIRIMDSIGSTALDALDTLSNFSLLVRLVLFVPPAVYCAVMVVARRTQPEKRLFWVAATLFQILLFVLIQPNFNM